MLNQFDEVRVEHEGSFEYTNNNKIYGSLFLFKLRVVVIDSVCDLVDHVLNGCLIIEHLKLKSFVTFVVVLHFLSLYIRSKFEKRFLNINLLI